MKKPIARLNSEPNRVGKDSTQSSSSVVADRLTLAINVGVMVGLLVDSDVEVGDNEGLIVAELIGTLEGVDVGLDVDGECVGSGVDGTGVGLSVVGARDGGFVGADEGYMTVG